MRDCFWGKVDDAKPADSQVKMGGFFRGGEDPLQQPEYDFDLSPAWYSHCYTKSTLGVAVPHLK